MTSRLVKFGDIAEMITKGTTPTTLGKPFTENGIRFLRAQNIQDGKVQFFDDDLFIDEETDELLSRSRIQPGDLLITIAGSIGRSGIVSGDFQKLNCNQAVAIVRLKNSEHVPFIRYWLESFDAKSQIRSSQVTATIPNLSLGEIRKLEIPLPPLEVQKRIASILDAADALRAKRHESLRKLEVLLKSVFLEMFGDPVTNPKGWEVRPFAEICDTRLGKMLDAKQQTGNHVSRYLRNSNVQWDRFELGDLLEMDFDDKDKREFSLRYGDLLICEGGAVGRTAIWREQLSDCYFQKALHRGRPKPDLATSEYLLFFLWYMADNGGLADFTTVATIAHLTGEKLRKVPTPVPSLELQHQFTNFYLEFQKKLLNAQTANSSLETLFSSLQDQAFNGTLESPSLAQLEVQTSLF